MTATVLLVEDERKLRELVRSYLERAGLSVLSTSSGAEAIMLAASAAPDLVVLDLGLPDVPGETVARELRAAGSVPILMLTAKAGEEDRIAVLQAGHEALLDGITQPTPDQLASLRDEVLRLARMVGDLQTLAAADAAVLHLTRRPCDLASIAAAAADSLAGQFEAAGILLERRLTAVGIDADPRWLHQVITNLLTNALKFTPAGGRVTITAGPSGAKQAVLTVTDTGTGIPADELPRIFDRFWRGRQAAQLSGSGIGLAVAAELARAHGGQLTARSQPGQGAELTLTLPGA